MVSSTSTEKCENDIPMSNNTFEYIWLSCRDLELLIVLVNDGLKKFLIAGSGLVDCQ